MNGELTGKERKILLVLMGLMAVSILPALLLPLAGIVPLLRALISRIFYFTPSSTLFGFFNTRLGIPYQTVTYFIVPLISFLLPISLFLIYKNKRAGYDLAKTFAVILIVIEVVEVVYFYTYPLPKSFPQYIYFLLVNIIPLAAGLAIYYYSNKILKDTYDNSHFKINAGRALISKVLVCATFATATVFLPLAAGEYVGSVIRDEISSPGLGNASPTNFWSAIESAWSKFPDTLREGAPISYVSYFVAIIASVLVGLGVMNKLIERLRNTTSLLGFSLFAGGMAGIICGSIGLIAAIFAQNALVVLWYLPLLIRGFIVVEMLLAVASLITLYIVFGIIKAFVVED